MKTAPMLAFLSVAAASAAIAAAPSTVTAQSGQAIYRQRCQACHGAIPGPATPMAPSLAGVVGRRAAATGFSYSPALKRSGLTWTRAELNDYLANPARKVPGGRMAVSIADPAQRGSLIDYLASVR